MKTGPQAPSGSATAGFSNAGRTAPARSDAEMTHAVIWRSTACTDCSLLRLYIMIKAVTIAAPPHLSNRAALVRALRSRADQVFSRAAGAPLIGGNTVRILRDARENYPAWEAAIRGAETSIHVEMYIIHRDST